MPPTVIEISRNGNPVGERVELGRYTVPAGERILYGQRVDGVVRFLPGNAVVFVVSSPRDESGRCRPRSIIAVGAHPTAARQGRRTAAGGVPWVTVDRQEWS